MTDVFTKKKRSEVMSLIKSRNTKPELFVRSFLHKKGYRFRLHQKNLPGKPDIVLKKYKTIINVNGCFWHHHQCGKYKLPKTNKKFWLSKLTNNRKRDLINNKKLKKLGWKVYNNWECRLTMKHLDNLLKKLSVI
ncbi:MAG: very short patch repair endonuclease [Pelagibacteraceae bacterium]|nr:very short patch repair endonuclease [Pelagibacteraceae bacterium]